MFKLCHKLKKKTLWYFVCLFVRSYSFVRSRQVYASTVCVKAILAYCLNIYFIYEIKSKLTLPLWGTVLFKQQEETILKVVRLHTKQRNVTQHLWLDLKSEPPSFKSLVSSWLRGSKGS